MSNKTPESRIGYGSQRNFDQGPSTYSDGNLLLKINKAAKLSDGSDSKLVVDLMSGPGRLGLDLQRLNTRHRFLFIDADPRQIEKARQASLDERNIFQVADIRNMPEIEDKTADTAVVCYGLKDLPWDEKGIALREIRRIMRPESTLVVADMVSPDQETQDWLNRQHRMKQEMEWRDPKIHGLCYIPRADEWESFLHRAGFWASVDNYHTSFVTTNDWVSGGQINEDQLAALNKFILQAPKSVTEKLNIRQEQDLVKIDYPLVIIRAVKQPWT